MNDSIDMTEFERGDVWETPAGKVLEVLDRAFIWGGKRWVAMADRDFDHPRLMSVAFLEELQARRRT